MAEDARHAERGELAGEASLAPSAAHAPRHGTGLRGVRRKKAKAEKPDDDRSRLRAFLGAVADRLIDTAPRIPVRDLATLREQFPGLGPEEIADKLVSSTMKGSATVGAGVGAAAMLPVPPAMPAELTAEVIGVASVELKLIAELHELYGQRPPGNARERALACLYSWAHERGVDPAVPVAVNVAIGAHLRRELRHTLIKRTMRNLPNLTPFMIGAVVGALMNRRDTKKLAERVRRDLRKRQISWDALPAQATAPKAADSQSALADSTEATSRSGRRVER